LKVRNLRRARGALCATQVTVVQIESRALTLAAEGGRLPAAPSPRRGLSSSSSAPFVDVAELKPQRSDASFGRCAAPAEAASP
jgi:hypothetical protein